MSIAEAGFTERKEMEIDSIFRMYSLSKPVTSANVLQLVEQGLVELKPQSVSTSRN